MKQSIIIILLALMSMPSKGQTLKDIFMNQDLTRLKTYIANRGANTPDQGFYPIVVASRMGNKTVVEQLISKGANIDARGHKKRTALMYAAKHNHKDIGLLLVNKRANLILKDASGQTAYDIAIKSGNKDFADEVIRKNLHLYADTDGPYIFEENGQFKAHYILPKAGVMKPATETIGSGNISSHEFHCHDKDGRTLFSFNVNGTEQIYPDTYDDNEPIFAISDIEGNLPALVNISSPLYTL